MFKGLTNFASILKEVQNLEGRTSEMRENLARMRVSGRAGGDAVQVEANGLQQILAVRIDRGVLSGDDAEMLEDLVLAATNQALEKSREAAAAEMSKMTSQFALPGLADMMSKFGLGQDQGGKT